MGTRNTALCVLSSRSAISRLLASTASAYSACARSLTSAMRRSFASSVRSAYPRICATSALRWLIIASGSVAISYSFRFSVLLSLLFVAGYQGFENCPVPGGLDLVILTRGRSHLLVPAGVVGPHARHPQFV